MYNHYKVELQEIHSGFDKKYCWVHSRGGAFPDGHVVITAQQLLLEECDVFSTLHSIKSFDKGQTWTGFVYEKELEKGAVDLEGADRAVCCDFVPKYHQATGKLLGIGQLSKYINNKIMPNYERKITYAVYNKDLECWKQWKVLETPNDEMFKNIGSGSAQRVDLPDGNILIPAYCKVNGAYSSVVLLCSFDGNKLTYIKHGNMLLKDEKNRGLYEPSLTMVRGKYYMTCRADENGYVAVSDDGLNFEEPIVWRWDDGSILPTYNTQQHWVTHDDELWLVYTRKGLNNDHVFRHRAPLVMAKVDIERMCIIRDSERILIPQRGARLGNFGVTEISQDETWVTVCEWMQPIGCEKYGSNNVVYVCKILWDKA